MADKRDSEWLDRSKNKPCTSCKGTGSAGKNEKGETIPCPSCRGMGY